MANIRLANTFYIDTQYSVAADELTVRNIKVKQIIVASSAAVASLVLEDAALGKKIEIKIDVADKTEHINLRDSPIIFSTSIRPTTLTNCTATVVIEEPSQK